ncbi:hypothetical protein BVY03_00215, partial [bacterium K02(2017)]
DSNGTWTLSLSSQYYIKNNVLVATATSTLENTSEFSVGYSVRTLVSSFQKISDTEGNFTAAIDGGDYFGRAISALGDLDGDGVTDFVVGVPSDDDGGTLKGAVYVLFMKTDFTVNSFQKISDTAGNFTTTFNTTDLFGRGVAVIGDVNGDGVFDLVAGAERDDDGGTNRGAVYVLFLNSTGTVSSYQKISDTAGNFTATLDNSENLGTAVSNLGDFDGDGINELAVGAWTDDDGGNARGAVYILFMNTDATVSSYQKISDTAGNFTATLDNLDYLGYSVANMGDLDGDGIIDLSVGIHNDDDGGSNRGAVYVLFMNTTGTVSYHQKISDTEGSFTAVLENLDAFGEALANVGDIDGDGISELVVGATSDDDGGSATGAVYIINFDNPNGNLIGTLTIDSHPALSSTAVNLSSDLTLTFTTENAIPANGDIDIIFPVGFDLTSIGSADVSEAQGDGGTLTTSINGHRMTINTGTATSASTQFALTITNLSNPTTAGSYGTFAIETQDENDAVIDQGIGNSVTVTAATYGYEVTKIEDTNNSGCQVGF